MDIASQGLKYGVALISILVLLCLVVVFLTETLKIIYHRFKLLGSVFLYYFFLEEMVELY